MNKNKPNIYTQTKKLICARSDKKNYLIQYRMLNVYVRHWMILDITREIISFKKSKRLEKSICFNSQKENQAVNDFEEEFYKFFKKRIPWKNYGKYSE